MKIRLLLSVKHGGVWYDPGARLSIDADDARTLVRKRAAEVIDDEISDTSESFTEDERESAIESLMEIENINDDLANRLFDAGFESVEDIANADPDDLRKIRGIGKKTVVEIQESADDILSSNEDEEDDD